MGVGSVFAHCGESATQGKCGIEHLDTANHSQLMLAYNHQLIEITRS